MDHGLGLIVNNITGYGQTATVFHTKRGNNGVFDILLDFSRIICPRVMIYISF